jgi:hypothetical protein
MEEQCSTLRKWLNARAFVYWRVEGLLEAVDTFYRQAATLDARLRQNDQPTEQELEKFVQRRAEALISAGLSEIPTLDALKVLIEQDGYEEVVKCLKAYEEEQEAKQKDKATLAIVTQKSS